MVQIRVEASADGRSVRLRVRRFGRKLDDPSMIIRYIATQRTLSRTGWSNSREMIEVAQELESRDLLLVIPPRLANHIDLGTGVEIEIPELGVSFQHAWMSEGQGLGTDVEVKEQSQPIEAESSPPADVPGLEPPPAPDTPHRSVEPQQLVAPQQLPQPDQPSEPQRPSELASASPAPDRPAWPREPEPLAPPPQPPGPQQAPGSRQPPERQWPPQPQPFQEQRSPAGTLPPGPSLKTTQPAKGRSGALKWGVPVVTFVIGVVAGAGALYAFRSPPPPLIQRVEVPVPVGPEGLVKRAYYPLQFDFARPGQKSPAGKTPELVAPPAQPDRASRFNREGLAAYARSGKPTEESIFWFKQAVRLCDDASIYGLGSAYWSGEGGLQKDRITGFQLMRFAASMGNRDARPYVAGLIRSRLVEDMPTANAAWYQ